MKADLHTAVALCTELEPIAAQFGYHTALTGGVLYKGGERKDIDIGFYAVDQLNMKRTDFLSTIALHGVEILADFVYVVKARCGGVDLDLMFFNEYTNSYTEAVVRMQVAELGGLR